MAGLIKVVLMLQHGEIAAAPAPERAQPAHHLAQLSDRDPDRAHALAGRQMAAASRA